MVFHTTPVFKKEPQLLTFHDELYADENAQWVSTEPSEIGYVFMNGVGFRKDFYTELGSLENGIKHDEEKKQRY